MVGAAIATLAPPHLSIPFHQYKNSLSNPNQYNKITRHNNSRLPFCNAKLSGESDYLNEVIFGADEVMEDYESDDEEEESTESSIDLLLRLLQSMFKKVSKRARKASRSILPDVISPQLVSFAVDGVLLLTSLSILKALLEVVCTLGGTVFVVILLLRVIWSAVAYFQSSGPGYNQGGSSYGRTQPVA